MPNFYMMNMTIVHALNFVTHFQLLRHLENFSLLSHGKSSAAPHLDKDGQSDLIEVRYHAP